jgi:drug/metabolite transporter (DMT)-like permease
VGEVEGMAGTATSREAGQRPGDLARLHLAVMGFGLAGVFGKLVRLGPTELVAGRAAFAALTIALGYALTGRAGAILPRQRRDGFALALGVLLAAHWWAFFQAVQVATVGVALVSFSIAPIFVLGMEALWQRRWPGLRPALASLVALAGVMALAPKARLADATVQGMLWGIASGAAYALLALLNRPLVATGSPWRLALWQNAVAALALSPFLSLAFGHASLRDWGLVALLGTLFTAGTHGLFLRSMRTVPAHLAVLTCTLEPGYGLIAAAVILGERPSPRTLLGAAMVAGSVAWATAGARRARKRLS